MSSEHEKPLEPELKDLRDEATTAYAWFVYLNTWMQSAETHPDNARHVLDAGKIDHAINQLRILAGDNPNDIESLENLLKKIELTKVKLTRSQ